MAAHPRVRSVRVLIVDDEALVRRALTVFLGWAEDIEIVGAATDGATAVDLALSTLPDVVLMDINLPGMSGIEATAAIIASVPNCRVIALSTVSSHRQVTAMLRAGASGFLVKDSEPEEICAAIRDVNGNQLVLSPRVTTELVSAVRRTTPDGVWGTGGPQLSERELAVVRLLGTGLSNNQMALELRISEASVKAALGKVMAKWGARDRVQVLLHAARGGLVSITEPLTSALPEQTGGAARFDPSAELTCY